MKLQEGSCDDNGAHYMRGRVQAGASAEHQMVDSFISFVNPDRSQKNISGALLDPECIPPSPATRLSVF